MALPVQLFDALNRLLGASWLAPFKSAFTGEGGGRFSSPVSFTATPRAGGKIYLSGSGLPSISGASQILSVKAYALGRGLIGEFYSCPETPFVWLPNSSELIVGGQDWVGVSELRVEVEAEHRGHDVSTNSAQTTPLTQPRPQQDSPQKVATGLGNGTEHEYFDVEQFRLFTVRVLDTPGAAGDNTYTLWTSQLNDGTAEAASDYQDRTLELVGQATVTGALILANPSIGVWQLSDIQAKRIRVTQVRANDGANNDGAYQYDAMGG